MKKYLLIFVFIVLGYSGSLCTDVFVEFIFDRLKNSCPAYNQSYDLLDKLTFQKTESRIREENTCEIMRVGEFEDTISTQKVIMSMRDSFQIMTFGETGMYTKSTIMNVED